MKKIITKLLVLLVFAVPLLAASPAYAADAGLFKGACPTDKSDPAYNSSVCTDARNQDTNNPIAGKNGVLQKVTLILSVIGGTAAVILAVLSGLTIVTSAGNSEKIASARRRLIYAIVGIIIIGIANLIVNFIIGHFT